MLPAYAKWWWLLLAFLFGRDDETPPAVPPTAPVPPTPPPAPAPLAQTASVQAPAQDAAPRLVAVIRTVRRFAGQSWTDVAAFRAWVRARYGTAMVNAANATIDRLLASNADVSDATLDAAVNRAQERAVSAMLVEDQETAPTLLGMLEWAGLAGDALTAVVRRLASSPVTMLTRVS